MQSFRLKPGQQFSLDRTLTCGQVFRWERGSDNWWYGILNDKPVRIRQDGDTIHYAGAGRALLKDYFSLDEDLFAIIASFDRDAFIHAAVERCHGLRLIRQPPWECLVSYICATNTNIPMIEKRLGLIAQRFGKPVAAWDRTFHTFPCPEDLAGDCGAALSDCKTGYRGRYVQNTACSIRDPEAWAEEISSLPYAEARKKLLLLPGVGPKAADCILLFAFQKYEAFPVDVWIRRIMRENYLPSLAGTGPLASREYERIRNYALEYFGPYCGYAQEYLYAYREEKEQKGKSMVL